MSCLKLVMVLERISSLVMGIYLLADSLVPLLRAKYLITPGQQTSGTHQGFMPPSIVYLVVIETLAPVVEIFCRDGG